MKKIMLLVIVVVMLAACGKGGDAPAGNAGGESRMKASSESGGKGGYGYDRAAIDYALKSLEKIAVTVKKLPTQDREKIVVKTVDSLRAIGKYKEEDLVYYSQKLRALYGL